MSIRVRVSTEARCLVPLQLELQVIMSQLLQALGTKLRASQRQLLTISESVCCGVK